MLKLSAVKKIVLFDFIFIMIIVEDTPGPSKYNTQKDLVWKDKKMTLKGKGKMTGVKQEGAGWNQSVGAAAYFVTHGNLGTGYAKYTMGLKGRIQNGPPNRLVHPVDTDGKCLCSGLVFKR